jgi:F0F1-type ATP synthase delta subunit
MSTTTSSKRYAQAVFQIAKEKNNLDEWLLDLRKIADLMHNPEFATVMENKFTRIKSRVLVNSKK